MRLGYGARKKNMATGARSTHTVPRLRRIALDMGTGAATARDIIIREKATGEELTCERAELAVYVF